MEKEFLVHKICDQKEKEYDFIRNLKVDEEGFPLDSEFDNFTMLENDKNVGILSEFDKITLICFDKDSKFRKVFLKEYKKILEDNVKYKLYSNNIDLNNELDNSEGIKMKK